MQDESYRQKTLAWNANLSEAGKLENFSFTSKTMSCFSQLASLGKSVLENPEYVSHNHAFEIGGSTKVNSEPIQNPNQSVSCHIESGTHNSSHKSVPDKFDQLSFRTSEVEICLQQIASYSTIIRKADTLCQPFGGSPQVKPG